MLFEVDDTSPVPLYLQIAACVRRAVAEHGLAPGSRLPPTRDVAAELSVNVHTVQRAYGLLRDEGILDLRQGRGAAVRSGALPPRARLYGLVHALLEEARLQGVTLSELERLMEETS
jgi:GntR family transcriptional regulator